MRAKALILTAFMALAAPVADAKPELTGIEIAPEATAFTLDNGLEVVVIPDHRAPIVTHMIWYRVGAADEPPGKSGIAHYLEHLMFKGTEANPDGAFSDYVASVGGRENAFTSSDYTGYFQQVAKEHLGDMMRLEADRMTGLALTPEVSAPELDVVLEERRMRVDNDPSSQLGESLDAALFVQHPYGNPVIGWEHEVSALTHEDALDFYRANYRPGNAVLVVAGDVTPAEVRALAEATYGTVPDPLGASERRRPQAPDILGKRTVELADERVNQPSVRRAWLVPSYTTAEPGIAEALDVLAQVLGGGSTGRLYAELVRGDGPAAAAGAWYQSSGLDDTRFMTWGVPKDGHTLAELEEGFERVIGDIAGNGVSQEELERAKTALVSSAVFAQDSQSSLARIFGVALTTGGTVEDVQSWPSRIAEVTARDVQAAAATFLDRNRSVTGRLLKPAS